MGSDITDTITDLIFQAEPNLASRLRSQDETLRETPCRSQELGLWFDTYDAAYLLSVIELGDETFVEEFPATAQISAAERARLLAALAAHAEECPHCALKCDHDFQMGRRIERVCRQNKDYLLRVLREEESALPQLAEGAAGNGRD